MMELFCGSVINSSCPAWERVNEGADNCAVRSLCISNELKEREREH